MTIGSDSYRGHNKDRGKINLARFMVVITLRVKIRKNDREVVFPAIIEANV